jgi:hypothetical protein
LPPKEFVVLQCQWVVERTFVSISNDRKVNLGTTRIGAPVEAPHGRIGCIRCANRRGGKGEQFIVGSVALSAVINDTAGDRT